MEKLNIAELLRDCPSGMELDCTMFDNLYFDRVDTYGNIKCYIKSKDGCLTQVLFLKNGCYNNLSNAKCVIFPKGKTTWEGFVPPCKFKDGDIVVCVDCYEPGVEEIAQIYILKYQTSENNGFCYTGYDFKKDKFHVAGSRYFQRHATEEEKQKLFDAIKANGYKWNPETKTLEKLIEPKFKVGDRIVKRNSINNSWIIASVSSEYYGLKLPKGSECLGVLPVSEQDDYELLPHTNKFDITTLKPFDSRVLVREGKTDVWQPTFYGFFHQKNKRFYTTMSGTWRMCIPYNEDTKHLIGTTNDCDDFYKTWK